MSRRRTAAQCLWFYRLEASFGRVVRPGKPINLRLFQTMISLHLGCRCVLALARGMKGLGTYAAAALIYRPRLDSDIG